MCLLLAWLPAVGLGASAESADGSVTAGDVVFATHLLAAVQDHPLVRAALFREQAARQGIDAWRHVFEAPELTAAAGYARGPDDLPGVSIGRVSPADAVTFSGGVELPVGGGVYAGVGLAQRVLTESSVGDDVRQTAVGARVRVPLLRDAGYGLYEAGQSIRDAEAREAWAERVRIQHDVARDALLAWSLLMRYRADLAEVERAVSRAERLYEQTSARVDLKDVAAYQVFPTAYEVALRREEDREIRQIVASGEETLRERLGLQGVRTDRPATAAVTDPSQGILSVAEWIARSAPTVDSTAAVLLRHPRCLIQRAREASAAAEWTLATERARDALDLSAGAGWRGETDSGLFGNDAMVSRRNEVLEVGIVWKRSLDKRGVRADVAAARSRLEAAREDRHGVDNEVLAAWARARTVFTSACGRLDLAASAVDAARQAMEAEESRFNLGEGTSRNVLDAQKDLTTAARRRVAVSAAVLDAWIELMHAGGQNPADFFAPSGRDPGVHAGLEKGE